MSDYNRNDYKQDDYKEETYESKPGYNLYGEKIPKEEQPAYNQETDRVAYDEEPKQEEQTRSSQGSRSNGEQPKPGERYKNMTVGERIKWGMSNPSEYLKDAFSTTGNKIALGVLAVIIIFAILTAAASLMGGSGVSEEQVYQDAVAISDDNLYPNETATYTSQNMADITYNEENGVYTVYLTQYITEDSGYEYALETEVRMDYLDDGTIDYEWIPRN